ncbi:MAG: hypothetical protein LBI95_04230 [Holosporales bacterium]|nr:hypothetical protein [Holosporales bacterium]
MLLDKIYISNLFILSRDCYISCLKHYEKKYKNHWDMVYGLFRLGRRNHVMFEVG